MLNRAEHEKSIITSGPDLLLGKHLIYTQYTCMHKIFKFNICTIDLIILHILLFSIKHYMLVKFIMRKQILKQNINRLLKIEQTLNIETVYKSYLITELQIRRGKRDTFGINFRSHKQKAQR